MRKASYISFLVLILACVALAKTKQDELAVAESSNSWFTSVSQLVVSPWNLMMAFMVSLPEILKSFDLLFSKLQDLSTSLLGNLFTTLFTSNAQQVVQAQDRYRTIQSTVQELVRLRQSMEIKCLYPRDQTARSLCVQREMDVTAKLQRARRQRTEWRNRLERLQQRA